MKRKLKKEVGITLISLVVTIIVLLILAGISINLTVGEHGIVTNAKKAREEMIIAQGKEKIEMGLSDISIGRIANGESCDLDYVSENIEGAIEGVKIEGIKGKPVLKIYLSYKDYMYKIMPDLTVKYIGNINIEEEPDIEIIRDVTETGVDKINLTVKASVEEGEISEIVKPNGEIVYEAETTYEISSNGSYTFKAVTEKGIFEEKTIEIQSIKDNDAIEIQAGTSGEGAIQCSHVYETKYNETSHWKQCIFCNNKINVVNHNMKTTGTETCNIAEPAQTKYCTDECGYKVTLPKKAHSNFRWHSAWENYTHRYLCGECDTNTKEECCYDSSGKKLGCSTGNVGTCAVCGYNYTNANHCTIRYGECAGCHKKFYDVSSRHEIIDETTTKYIWHISNIESGLILKDREGLNSIMRVPNIGGLSVVDSSFTKNNDGSIDVTKTIKTSKDTTTAKAHIGISIDYEYNGYKSYIVEYCDEHYLVADNYAPKAKSITVEGADSTTDFSRSATITAKFEETWDSIVEMALYDSDGSVISDWSIASKDGTIFTKTFNVVAETVTSKELTVKAKDRCGNIGEGKVTIGKIDTKVPTLVSETEYNKEWKILKPIRIEATDEGSRNVQIALGSEDDYQLGKIDGNKYYREYKLTGDVYEDVVRIVYLRDGVGNVATKRINIGKIDKTSPTITNITAKEKTITIEANDMNIKLNKEGSGIKGYAISKTREVPADNGFQTSNKFTVKESGIYYIWAKDNAGNLSQTKQIEIK